MADPEFFKVAESGSFSVIRFRDRIDEFENRTADIYEEISRFIAKQSCVKLAIDLSAVEFLPSSMLAMLARLHTKGVEIHLLNAQPALVEVLHVTQLDKILHLDDLEPDVTVASDSVVKQEHTVVGLHGYFIKCAGCQSELKIRTSSLGGQVECSDCEKVLSVTAETFRQATHVWATCPSCEKTLRLRRYLMEQAVVCKFCQGTLTIQTLV